MKFIILKENLIKGLNIVGRVTGKNLTLPILNNILITAEKNLLNLSATDLELGMQYWSLIKIEKEGKITVPAKILSGFVGFLPEEKLNIEEKNQTLYLDCQNYKTKIKGLGVEEFPIIPTIKDKEFIEVKSDVFCAGLAQVVDFCLINQARPELSGVYLNFQKNMVKIAATDGFRLAEKIMFFEETKPPREFSFILPQRAAREVINVFSDQNGKIKIYFSPNQVLFESLMTEVAHAQIQIISRLIEGEYPDYQGIIPQGYKIRVVLNKDALLNQIKTASVFSGRSNEVRVKALKDGLEILSQNPELGQSQGFLVGEITRADKEGETSEVIFNHRFLTEGLNNIKSQRVIFDLTKKGGEDGPAVLRPEGDDNYLYVVMPIKNF